MRLSAPSCAAGRRCACARQRLDSPASSARTAAMSAQDYAENDGIDYSDLEHQSVNRSSA